MMYMINVGELPNGIIHKDSCGNYTERNVEANWRGPYASCGGAIDAILSMDSYAREGRCCITNRVNAEDRR